MQALHLTIAIIIAIIIVYMYMMPREGFIYNSWETVNSGIPRLLLNDANIP